MKSWKSSLAVLLLWASVSYAQVGYFVRTDCGSITSPVNDSTACLQTTTVSGRTAGHVYIRRTGAWVDVDTTGGAVAFSAITGATNTTAAMIVGTGASLAATGSGTIAATTSLALAADPSNCAAGAGAGGVSAAGAAQDCTVYIQGTIAADQIPFGTAANTIGGDADFKWTNSTNVFSITGKQTLSKDITDLSTSQFALRSVFSLIPAVDDVTNTFIATSGEIYTTGAEDSNITIGVYGAATRQDAGATGTLTGVDGEAFHQGSTTVSQAYGVYGQAANTAGGTITDAYGIHGGVVNSGAGTIVDAYGLHIMSTTNSGGGTVTTNYGIRIDDQTVGGTDYSIWLGAGLYHLDALTASRPIYSDASKNLTSGSFSGNTTTFATTSGALTSGNCVKIDASGNLVDHGSACGGSGSPGGVDTQVQFNDAGSFGGDAGLVFNKTTNVLTAGEIIDSGLTASRLVASDASKQLVSTITSANTAASVSDETGTGALVFGTDPALTAPAITGTPNAAGELGYNSTNGATTQYSGLTATVAPFPRVLSAAYNNDQKTNSVATDQDFTSIYTIPANVIIAGKILMVSLLFQNVTDAAAAGINIYLKLGATKVYTHSTAQNSGNNATRSWKIDLMVLGTAAAGAAVAVVTIPDGVGNNTGSTNNTTQPVNLATNGTLAVTPGIAFNSTAGSESMTLLGSVIMEMN